MTTPTIQTAMAFHGQGRLAEAEQAYGTILAQNPTQYDALHFLGVLKLQQGNAAAAHALISKALEGRPQATDALCNLSVALLMLNRHGDALAICERVLAANPLDVETLYNHGQALLGLQRYAQALASYDKVLGLKPGHVNALFNRSNALAALGRNEEALASYDKLIAFAPGHVDALSNRGNVLMRLDRAAQALQSYDQALAVKRDHAKLLLNRASALIKLGRHDEALASLDRSHALEPDQIETLKSRAIVLQAASRPDEAAACYERILGLSPNDSEAFTNRGLLFFSLGRVMEAMVSYDRALEIKPDQVEALNNRGVALAELGRTAEALASYDRLLAIRPDHVEALNNRGIALVDLGRCEEGLASYDRALAVNPNFPDALNNRGNVLAQLDRRDEALAACERVLAIKPDHLKALVNRGMLLGKLHRYDEALADLDKALAIKPDDVDGLSNRGLLLREVRRHEDSIPDFEKALAIKPDFPYLRGALVYAKLQCSAWSNIEQDLDHLGAAIRAGKRATEPFPALAAGVSSEEQLRATRVFAADKYPASASPVWRSERYVHDRIRVAYVSAEFREQATSYLIAELFELHDRQRFEVIAIATGDDDRSPMRERLQRSVDRFLDVSGQTDEQIARQVRELEIDILVDLNGYFGGERTGIFARRPAPVQVSYLGYPATMGASYIDYIIADRWVIPADRDVAYAEKIVYLPNSYQVNDSRRAIAEQAPSRHDAGLPEHAFVFCCFNQNYKIMPATFDIWMRLLQQVEGSVLWLLEGNASAMRNLRLEAEKRGIAPDRLIFASRVQLDQHLARHRLADLFLDTLPVNAHTTASDALWTGLPVVTSLGTTFGGRVAASLLDAVGLADLIARSAQEYEALALRLAKDPAALAETKAKLERNRAAAPLFDSDRYRRHIEAAYARMYEIGQRGDIPEGFSIDPS